MTHDETCYAGNTDVDENKSEGLSVNEQCNKRTKNIIREKENMADSQCNVSSAALAENAWQLS